MWLVGSRESSVTIALLYARGVPSTLRIGGGASEDVAAQAAVATQTVFLTHGRRVCGPRQQSHRTRCRAAHSGPAGPSGWGTHDCVQL
jgi:hypothetical protein